MLFAGNPKITAKAMAITMFIPTTPNVLRANIIGSPIYPDIQGTVFFRKTPRGVLVRADISGLPISSENCGGKFLGFHIHSGDTCTGNAEDPFANTLSHYNPDDCLHPHHAGDLPPLLNAGGYAVGVCLTNRFELSEIIGKTIVIHSSPDDFSTQPSGNSGTKIACGEIRAIR